MKRRNADLGKMRRPIKRNKITEGIYGRYGKERELVTNVYNVTYCMRIYI